MMRVGFFLSLLGFGCFAACSSTTKVTHEGTGGAGGADSGSSASGGQGGAGGSTGGVAGTTGGSAGSSGGSSGGSGGSVASGGSGGAATGGSGGSAGASACPDATQVRGPSLVYVDGFCIDSTEVTNAQYEEFVNAKNGDASGQISACSTNASYVPSSAWPAATDEFNWPVAYVDWCDAYAYCAWAGKRLCGKIGGGTNDYAAFADANLSQWYRVCSNGGRNTYPYGGTYDPTKCNGYGGPDGCNGGTSQTCSRVDVGTYTECQGVGAYAGVYDLSGNMLEWEDSCSIDPTTNASICRIRGGAIYAQGASDMSCDTDTYNERLDDTAPGIGFRCCYE